MSLMTKSELALLGTYVVVRTDRGNEIVKSDPRQMPRRLRVLLLAIDGGQPVNLYTQTLKGFGDVSDLLIELVNLGMVRLVEPTLAKKAQLSGRSDQFAALDQMLDDSRFNSESAADVFYGSTTPGSFDEMVRVARIDRPEFKPAVVAAPAPVAAPEQKKQIESLFNLLESVRGERSNLKQQIAKLQRVKEAAIRLHHRNEKLQNWVYGLGITCTLLATSLIIVLFRR
ncbi:hypothetical protein [Variovorax sp. PCZ-1]|uniref:hypothetical protein n=1 Tax=Variovorax sp. PCZ-1 TaxID=2835533 RepID=UPI001BD1B00F|nr:hypothetical protein [Variovorax sp. PCZ-1]MBS7807293.1 hypothetical protein [Variovorax sp. PCZ-1]